MPRPAFRRIRDPGIMFLDSGAFGLYAKHCQGKKGDARYKWFRTRKFKRYVDNYAKFVHEHKEGIDLYANVDVLDNPEMSWKVLKYLEKKWGLNPVPVVHPLTDIKWIKKHVEAGYDPIGIGGGGRGRSKGSYLKWADSVFEYLCPASNNNLPIVRVHGFALTAYDLMMRYPWWSVDSTSWVQTAAWGAIHVPHYRGGKFVFDIAPYTVVTSPASPAVKDGVSLHYMRCSRREKEIINKWLTEIEVPLGEDGSWGVTTEHNARKVANLRFFEIMVGNIPEWPWPFHPKFKRRGFL